MTLSEIGWTDAQVLEVDLQRDGVRTDLLTAGPVARGSALSAQVREAGAVAGVNGDFFDINNSNAAIGPEILGGAIRKSGIGRTQVAGVSDRPPRPARRTSRSTPPRRSRPARAPVRSLNDPTDVGTNNIAAYTPLWGTFTRTRGVQGATNVAEVIVTDGKVASINPTTAGAGELPANSFALVGREAGADALRALQVGDAVTLAYDLKSDIADKLTFAVGGNVILVKDGVPQPGAGGELAPRTAIGFKDGGKTLMLVTADGRQSLVAGPTVRADRRADGRPRRRDRAQPRRRRLDDDDRPPARQPARDASATRRPTAASAATRTASASSSTPGDGTVHDLVDRPAPTRASSPACAARFTAAGLDDRDTPVPAALDVDMVRRQQRAHRAGQARHGHRHRQGRRRRGDAPTSACSASRSSSSRARCGSQLRRPGRRNADAARQRPRRRRLRHHDRPGRPHARLRPHGPDDHADRRRPARRPDRRRRHDPHRARGRPHRPRAGHGRRPARADRRLRHRERLELPPRPRRRRHGRDRRRRPHGQGPEGHLRLHAGHRHPQRRRRPAHADDAPRPAAARVACGSRATATASG